MITMDCAWKGALMNEEEIVQLKHPDPNKQMPRISKHKYAMVRKAILEILPFDNEGFLFKELAESVARFLSKEQLEDLGSVGWHTTSIKLDLEARGLIERIPGRSPQRLRRVSRALISAVFVHGMDSIIRERIRRWQSLWFGRGWPVSCVRHFPFLDIIEISSCN
jgi:hypothetical protein